MDDGRVVAILQVTLALAIVLGVFGQRMLLSLCHRRLIVAIYHLAFLPGLFQEKLRLLPGAALFSPPSTAPVGRIR